MCAGTPLGGNVKFYPVGAPAVCQKPHLVVSLPEIRRRFALPDLAIVDLSNLEPGRIFYSGRLYIIEWTGSTSKARPWDSSPGTTQGCVTLSPKSPLANFYPVVERAMVLPLLKRSDFYSNGRPTLYRFKAEKDAQRAAQLDRDLAVNSGLGTQRIPRMGAWLLTDGANPHRLYCYPTGASIEAVCAAYCAQYSFVEGMWPDERTRHWPLLFNTGG